MSTDVAEALAQVAESVFGVCDDIADRALPAWRHGDTPVSSAVDIDEGCRRALATFDLPLAGVGIVVAPDALADRRHWLRWWQPDANGAHLLRIQTDPAALDFHDYTTLAWFTVPAQTGRRHVTGPYVDYVCTDRYTLTFTRPLVVWERSVGVAGVDVLVHDLEAHVLARCANAGDVEWVTVTEGGRVVTAANSDLTTGDLLLPHDGADEYASGACEVVPCPGLPWRVLSRDLSA